MLPIVIARKYVYIYKTRYVQANRYVIVLYFGQKNRKNDADARNKKYRSIKNILETNVEIIRSVR